MASERQSPGSGPSIPPDLRREIVLTMRAHTFMDEAWDGVLKLNAQQEHPGNVACAAGCSACCSYLVDTISSEGVLIAASIENSDADYRNAAMERLLDWEYEFEHWLLKHPIPNDGVKDHEHDLWRGAWQVRRIACPFLDLNDNRCSIYADRPATCRGHHACYPPPEVADKVSQPPDGCFTSLEDLKRGEMTPIWQLNNEMTQIFSGVLAEALDGYGVAYTSHLLPIMVLRQGRARFGWPAPNPRKHRRKPPRITHARIP